MENFDFPIIDILYFVFIFTLGLCLGSFATALIYRIPNGISWVLNNPAGGDMAARSRCPDCMGVLGVVDLVPVFSWLFFGGKCRQCKSKISCLYPVIEMITALLVAIMYFGWGWTLVAAPIYIAVGFFVAAVKIGWDRGTETPSSINKSLTILAILYVGLRFYTSGFDGWMVWEHLAAGILLMGSFWCAGAVFYKLKRDKLFGGGELRFLMPAGLFLGLPPIPSFLFFCVVFALISAIFEKYHPSKKQRPLGIMLVISLYLHLFLTGIGFH